MMTARTINKLTVNRSPARHMGGRAPQMGTALQPQNIKSSSKENDCRNTVYTVDEAVDKLYPGILPRAANDSKREIVKRNVEQNPNLHTPTYSLRLTNGIQATCTGAEISNWIKQK